MFTEALNPTVQNIVTFPELPRTSCRTSSKARHSSSEFSSTCPRLSLVDRFPYSDWDFFTDADPTHGNVIYESKQNATDLAYVQPDGTAVLKVDNVTNVAPGGNRRS